MSGGRSRPGRTKSNAPPEGQSWVWMTSTMFGSITFRALGIHARRILDFLLYEHAGHGGRENGSLAAPYNQLEAWGVTAADVRKGFEQLYATGFVRRTQAGDCVDPERLTGRPKPARYALTWLPTHAGSPAEAVPTHDWTAVLSRLSAKGIGTVGKAKAWLRTETSERCRKRPTAPPTKRASTSHLRVVPPLTCEAEAAS